MMFKFTRNRYRLPPLSMRLSEHDHVVAVAAEPPSVFGAPLWFIVQDDDGKLRRECLQPDEQTDGMRLLYATAAAVHGAMVREVEAVARRSR